MSKCPEWKKKLLGKGQPIFGISPLCPFIFSALFYFILWNVFMGKQSVKGSAPISTLLNLLSVRKG